jgi:uncharacterized protein involved in exopolysaccharide biosynthesis
VDARASRPADAAGGGRAPRAGSPSLRDVSAFAFRHARLATAVIVGVTALVALLAYSRPATYASTTLLLVEVSRNPTLRTEVVNETLGFAEAMTSEIELIRSRTVAERVVDGLGLDRLADPPVGPLDAWRRGASEWLRARGVLAPLDQRESAVRRIQQGIDISQPQLSNLLAVRFASRDAGEAARIAGAVTDAYLELRRLVYRDDTHAFLEARVSETEQELERVLAGLRRQASEADRLLLDVKRRALESSYLFYRERLDRARADQVADVSLLNVRVVDPPRIARAPERSPLSLVLAALPASLVLALGLALVRDYLDPRVHSADDVRSVAGVPVLGSVRRTRGAHRALRRARARL